MLAVAPPMCNSAASPLRAGQVQEPGDQDKEGAHMKDSQRVIHGASLAGYFDVEAAEALCSPTRA